MFDASDPLVRAVQAKYDDIMTQFYRQADKANAAHEEAMAEWNKHVTEQAAKDKAELDQLVEEQRQAQEARQKATEELAKDPNARNQWLRPREQGNRYLSFGAQDEEPTSRHPRNPRHAQRPGPRAAAPRVPPRPEPRQERPTSPFDRRPSPFEDYPDEGAPSFIVDPTAQQSPPAAPTPAKKAARPRDDYDDEDFSNNSWMR